MKKRGLTIFLILLLLVTAGGIGIYAWNSAQGAEATYIESLQKGTRSGAGSLAKLVSQVSTGEDAQKQAGADGSELTDAGGGSNNGSIASSDSSGNSGTKESGGSGSGSSDAGGASSSSGSSGRSGSTGGSGSGSSGNSPTSYTCTISIDCTTILDNLDSLDSSKTSLVPSSGTILSAVSVSFTEGESVYDVLNRVCRDYGIPMEASFTPGTGSAYIEGIYNLYEFDCGNQSGWMYSVNGTFPNVSCSSYTLSSGDTIRFRYTCRGYGADLT